MQFNEVLQNKIGKNKAQGYQKGIAKYFLKVKTFVQSF